MSDKLLAALEELKPIIQPKNGKCENGHKFAATTFARTCPKCGASPVEVDGTWQGQP